jgi:hypothetical protein
LLSGQDRADRSLHQFLTEIPLAPDVSPIWFRPILHEMRYQLGDERRNADGKSASVPVQITTVDLPLWERTLDAQAESERLPSQLAQRSLDTGAYPRLTYQDRILLVKDHHHWRVAAGFAARDRVLDQHHQAMVDFYEARLDEAIVRYHSMIAELDNQPGTGNLGLAARFNGELAKIEKIKLEIPVAATYGANLKLTGVTMRMAEERVPAIFGEVTNSGSRPIDELRLAVTWYQGRGKNLKIAHREEHPIVLTPIEFTDFSRAVIPFLPGESRQFGFILSAPPEVQQNAAPYVRVGPIAFTQLAAPLPKLETASNPGVPHSHRQPVAAATPNPPSATAAAKPTVASPPLASGREPGVPHSTPH